MALIEGSRFNEFAYWTRLRVRVAELRLKPLQALVAEFNRRRAGLAPLAAPAADKTVEPVQ
jgi:hypothetical protein